VSVFSVRGHDHCKWADWRVSLLLCLGGDTVCAENFRPFFEEEFDASRLANAVTQGSSVIALLAKVWNGKLEAGCSGQGGVVCGCMCINADVVEQLSSGVQALEKEIHGQVVSHHEGLLRQATGIEVLEGGRRGSLRERV
jgi:hypothetical protein